MEVEKQFEQLFPGDCCKLTAVMLLTDGCLKRRNNRNAYQVVYYGKDAVLHQVFKLLAMRGLGGNPSSFLWLDKRSYRTIFERGLKSQCMNALFSLTPSFKTSPGRLEKVKYLETHHPTIKFLYDEPLEVKILAFRLAMSAEGSISILENGTKFRLNFGCAHPMLAKEWKNFIKSLGISMYVTGDRRTWSGIQGLSTGRRNNLLKFSELGGFINGVKAHKSQFYPGLEKNLILLGAKMVLEGKSNSLKDTMERICSGSWGSLAYPSGLRLSIGSLPTGA